VQRAFIARSGATAINRLMRLWLVGVLRARVLGGGSATDAAEGTVENVYDIPSEAADQALIEFARQTKRMKWSVLVRSGGFAQITTNSVRGQYRPDDALNILLRDTGLVGSVGASGIVAVTRGEEHEGQ
jgi:hypothetical protein